MQTVRFVIVRLNLKLRRTDGTSLPWMGFTRREKLGAAAESYRFGRKLLGWVVECF